MSDTKTVTTSRKKILNEAINQIPSSWLDPIFSDPYVGDAPYGCKQVEAMFRRLRTRIEDLKNAKR